MKASTKMRRKFSPRSASNASAPSGPSTAPAVSTARWNPKARPRSPRSVHCATSASRGAVRTPLPNRSTNRAKSTTGQWKASASSGLATAASP